MTRDKKMGIKKEHVEGYKKADAVLYALSTCQWCRKTKNLLSEMGIDYYYIDVDLAGGDDQKNLIETIKKYNPACSFPTLIINGSEVLVGFDEIKIRKKLG
jgi:glutaredoxin-like protein NrdH